MAEIPSPLELAVNAREALRRIREAALLGRIRPNEMQEQSKEVLQRFARALLERTNKSNLLHEEHRSANNIHHLNEYIADLHSDLKGMKLTGNPLTVATLQLYINTLSSPNSKDKFKNPTEEENPILVGVLSTGALALALLSYLHNVDLYVAAAGKDPENLDEERMVVIPELPEDRPITVIDDIVGKQASAINKHFRAQNRRSTTSDLMGKKGGLR